MSYTLSIYNIGSYIKGQLKYPNVNAYIHQNLYFSAYKMKGSFVF